MRTQQLENSTQTHYENNGDERFLRYMDNAPSGQESCNSIQNDPSKRWGGIKKYNCKNIIK
jgi:hypothetical protein